MALISLIFSACATGKMGKVEQPLEKGSISKTTPIIVQHISAADAGISGDKAGNAARVSDEKVEIYSTFSQHIVEALTKKGYTATVGNGKETKGIVLTGSVTKIENGSAAARMFVGAGAGSANMFTTFHLDDKTTGKSLAKFEIIGTSGGSSNVGSFLVQHMTDSAKKIAQYVNGEVK